MFEVLKDIKLAIGVLSTLMIIISAFRYEIIDANEYQSSEESSPASEFVIDKQVLDALAKFDRNVRHLQIKGKESLKNDCMNILPDFKEAVAAASKIISDMHKLNIYPSSCKGAKKYNKEWKSKKGKSSKTLSFSFRIGSKVHMVSFYWPKLLRLFTNDDSD